MGSTIKNALHGSEYLIYLASKEAAEAFLEITLDNTKAIRIGKGDIQESWDNCRVDKTQL